jgi:hypothetical protein
MRGLGSQRLISRFIRVQVTWPFWLRLHSARRQSLPTRRWNEDSARLLEGPP